MEKEDEHRAVAQLKLPGPLTDHLAGLFQERQGKTRAVGR
jgi:hypothetical protein